MAQTNRTEGLVGNTAMKQPCRVATTTNITLSGLQTVDGIALASGDRVLVKDQTTNTENGIWVADSGAWNRSQDFDGSYDVVQGTLCFIVSGVASGRQFYEVTSAGSPTPGTDAITWAYVYVDVTGNTQQSLNCYLLPSTSDGWRGIYRSGFDQWSRNQQWGGPFGGEMVDAAAGTLHKTEFATGYIDFNLSTTVGNAAADTYRATGFKIPETQTVSAIWLKLSKIGNPANNLGVFVYSDDGVGKPNALVANGTATAQSGKLHTADINGAWYRFVFATPPSLTGGTQYHVVIKSSGAVDASNYWNFFYNDAKTYPFGYLNTGDGTPTWTGVSTNAMTFLVELSATAQTLQASGQFDGKLQFGGSGASGTLSMSRGLCNSVPLRELIDVTDSTGYLVGTTLTKDATILDIGYGEDHDRIVIRSNVTTGYGQIDVYDSAGTKITVTATAVDLSTGTHSVGWRVSEAVVKLFIDGTTYTSGAVTIAFDANFANLGTMWIGGGFALAPTWTQKLTMATIPSANGWTWTGTGTEADCMSIQGGKLFQNKNGYASTDTGYYVKAAAGFSNAAGNSTVAKGRIVSCPNTKSESSAIIDCYDGTKRFLLQANEYWLSDGVSSSVSFPQCDLKSHENVVTANSKGSDALVFVNRKLSIDASGAVTSASATNAINFGDFTATAGENADVIYSYVAYYNTAWNPPQFTAGSISEFAIWQGDLTALWPLLYNAGAFVSVKELLGVQQNYIDKSARLPTYSLKGITSAPTTTSTTAAVLNEMEAFCIGETMSGAFQAAVSNSTVAKTVNAAAYLDGVEQSRVFMQAPVAAYVEPISANYKAKTYLGLHKTEARWYVDANTATASGTLRNLVIEGKA